MLTFRQETEEEKVIVEELVREAFWNHFQPGADEHYLLHILRSSPDYIPELSLIACDSNEIVGQITYTHAKIVDENDESKVHPVILFGPVSVKQSKQSMGYGTKLINHTLEKAKEMGFKAVIIYGDPRYYQRFGFRCGERFEIKTKSGKYQTCLLVLPLHDKEGFLNGKYSGRFHESDCFEQLTPEKIEEFDRQFRPLVKETDTPSQREFQILTSLSY